MDAVTTLLRAIGRGEGRALGELYALLYPELLRLARARLRRGAEPAAIDAHALVHESFLRFAKTGAVGLSDRGHFMAYAARVMRSVILDANRRQGCDRRGGNRTHVALDDEVHDADDVAAAGHEHDGPTRRVHESLAQLAAVDARLARVVELRYFTGLTEAEIAGALGIGVRTVSRDWEKAKAFLQSSLG